MIIRKQFKFEGAHVVRNCSSERCKKSIHGHSYIVELMLESDTFDNGQMVYDFGLLKGTVNELIDSFDHTYVMWDVESDEFKSFMKSHSDRWIEMNVSPSAEMFAVMFFKLISHIIESTDMKNGEGNVRVAAVRVHETATGWAEATAKDVEQAEKQFGKSINVLFSAAIRADWKHFIDDERVRYSNEVVDPQIIPDYLIDRDQEDSIDMEGFDKHVLVDGQHIYFIAGSHERASTMAANKFFDNVNPKDGFTGEIANVLWNDQKFTGPEFEYMVEGEKITVIKSSAIGIELPGEVDEAEGVVCVIFAVAE